MTSQKKVLVTGSSGFVGKSLVKWLTNLEYEVATFDQEDGNIAFDKLTFSGISHVFHLASKVYVPASWDETFDFYQTNVMGTVNVLELCRANHCSLTYISSYVYGPPHYLPVDEKHPVFPASPYNHSKLVAEDICRYYSQTFDIPVTVMRPVNIYGPGQNLNFLIPTIIRQVYDKDAEKVEVMDLKPKRDYLYVEDFINALISTINNKVFDIFNIGSGYSVSVEEIIQIVMLKADISKPYSAKNVDRLNEVWDVYADISKINRHLKWQPRISFVEGIALCLKAIENK